ncbi:hypothetical protein OHA40_20905 [Nocardia sp. NBC_00508]|uniref:hypothetical protein n=1 Tax=Nocardia sp. NBC_00508 TaxID=2975992 RepID=UPI002E80544D|nr:hypothetical protein [Nocardia sp. NBC_00508]WUD64168.1 hypothetical protein OHA40_20905 [Nocardia sp. NBC_00508]
MRQTDGRVITNPENAHSFSHAEIKQAADAMNPAELGGALDAWAGIAAAVTNAGQEFETAIKKAVEQHWEGAAAESAVRGVRDYAARVGEFGEALGVQSGPLSAAANAAARFKMSVPDVLDTSGSPADPQQRNSREEQARDEMNTQYIQPYGSTAPAIPTLPPPLGQAAAAPGVETGNGVQADTSVSSQALLNGTGRGDTASSDDTSASESSGSPGGADAESTPDAEVSPTSEGAPETVAAQSVAQNHDIGTPTAAASTARPPTSGLGTPIAPTMPLPTAPATVTPTSFNGTPSRPGTPGSLGRPSITGDNDNQPRPGTSRAAPPTAPAASTAPSAVPGRPGAPGLSGYSGLIPPGMRGKGADDDEHKSPKYLRTEEHAKELLGEVKPTVPPVLGEQ